MIRVFPALLLCLVTSAFGQGPNIPPKVSLKLDAAKVKPGETFSGNVTVTFAEGLHGYQNPPSEDYMIPVAVKADGPVSLESATYPTGINAQVGGATEPVKVYEGTIVIPVKLKAPGQPGSYETKIVVSYQQCDANACFAPGKQTAVATLVVSEPAKPAEPSKSGEPAKAPGKAEPTLGKAAQAPPKSSEPSAPTKAEPEPPKEQPVIEPTPAEEVDPDAPVSSTDPSRTATGGAEPPSVTLGAETSETPTEAEPPAQKTQGGQGFVAGLLREGFSRGNYGIILLAALLTGLALALTPCVYPMIPVTVSFFSGQAAGSQAARIGLGAMYMLGIAATYGAFGGVMSALGKSVGSLFTQPWFLLFLGGFLIFLALSMFDVYEIRIPSFIGKHIKGRSGAVGALIMGLLVGVAAAPCAGALVSGIAVEIASLGSVPIGVMVFTVIGMGIGLPFMALSAVASGAKALPKSGGWLKTVKAILGLIVIWIALGYLLQAFQFRIGEPRTFAVNAGFFILAALYLLAFDNSGATRLIMGLKGAAILFFGIMAGQAMNARATAVRDQEIERLMAQSGGSSSLAKVDWIPFTRESFEEAKKSGKPIVIDASADWCTICHEIDRAVFQPPRGVLAMQKVVPLKIDHSTGVPQEYINWTSQLFGIRGLPHLVFMRPGGDQVRTVTGKAELDTVEELQQYIGEIGG